MRVLLDTNIVIHREADTVVNSSIGLLFRWLDKLKIEKCVHPVTLEEISRHGDDRVRKSFEAKLQSYAVLKSSAPMAAVLSSLSANVDRTDNDRNDTALLNELVTGRVEAIISEDLGIHSKAARTGVVHSVYSIDSFLEKVTAENPELTDYKVLSVKKELFGRIKVEDPFFDSFRSEYRDFNRWFARKSDELAYICTSETGEIVAFLYLKERESRGKLFRYRPAIHSQVTN